MLRGDADSENMDDEGAPEIASIHESPQKRHSSITGAAALH